MLVIQHNCWKSYAIILAAFKSDLILKAPFIYLWEPYINVYSFSHPDYKIRWPEKEKMSEKKVLIGIRRDLLIKVITESHFDFINHAYFLAINVWELHSKSKQKIQKTHLIIKIIELAQI